ncbi:MAG: hypothetical protein JXQ96_11425 [Cyclobacteriaceae bacterium]
MTYLNNIHNFPNYVKRMIFFFTLSMTVGYFTGFNFIYHTTELKPKGIEQNYNGNEEDEDAEVMMFKKPEKEILTTIHTHILSFSLIFIAMGGILLSVPMNQKIKSFLLVEPFISTIVTFGGIWLLWKGMLWMKYFVMLSGILLTLTFVLMAFYIFKATLTKATTD